MQFDRIPYFLEILLWKYHAGKNVIVYYISVNAFSALQSLLILIEWRMNLSSCHNLNFHCTFTAFTVEHANR